MHPLAATAIEWPQEASFPHGLQILEAPPPSDQKQDYKTWVAGRMQINGGQDLAESAAYTRPFSREVLSAFHRAASDKRLSGDLMSYKALWERMRFESVPYEPRVRNLQEERE